MSSLSSKSFTWNIFGMPLKKKLRNHFLKTFTLQTIFNLRNKERKYYDWLCINGERKKGERDLKCKKATQVHVVIWGNSFISVKTDFACYKKYWNVTQNIKFSQANS